MISSIFDPYKADIVFVGGGPVALWTAINTKMQNSKLKIVVLEKYTEYKRIHNLFIESASLKTDISSPLLDGLIRELKKHKVISTMTLESKLAELAEKVGVAILKNREISNPKEDLKPFTLAKVIVGADGAHSIMRQQVTGEDAVKSFLYQKELHYIADLTYPEVKSPIGFFEKISVNSAVGNFIYEIHSNKAKKTTLRTFIDAHSFAKMKQATRKTPENVYSDVVVETVRQEFLRFLKTKYGSKLDDFIDLKAATVTTTMLGTYISKKMVKHENGQTWCLVGDAAFGVPFFKSLNNGLVSGTRLAKIIAASFEEKEEKIFSSLNEDHSFEKYESFMHRFAKWQVRIADVKSFGVNSWIKIAKMFQGFYGPSIYLEAAAPE